MVFGQTKINPDFVINLDFVGTGDLDNWNDEASMFYTSVKLENLTEIGRNKFQSVENLSNCLLLYCSNNKLTKLPNLPLCKTLNCSNNELENLPLLPNCTILTCSNNQLTKLPDLPMCKNLHCQNNKLKFL